jgi:hypothetical protein
MSINNYAHPSIFASFDPFVNFPLIPTVATKFISHLLGDFKGKVGREDIFYPEMGMIVCTKLVMVMDLGQ